MVGVDVYDSTEKHGKEFLVHRCIVFLSTIELLAIIGHRFAVLRDASSELVIRRICVDVERKFVVRVGAEHVRGHQRLHAFECRLHVLGPHKLGLLGTFLRCARFCR